MWRLSMGLFFLTLCFMGYSQDIRTKGTFEGKEEPVQVKKATIRGKVMEVEGEKGVPNVKIQLVDMNRNLVVEKTNTGANGEFSLYHQIGENFMIYVEYQGMPPLMVPLEASDKSVKILKVESSWSWVKN